MESAKAPPAKNEAPTAKVPIAKAPTAKNEKSAENKLATKSRYCLLVFIYTINLPNNIILVAINLSQMKNQKTR